MSTRITDLPQAETLNGSEIMPLVQNGVTKKATLDFINLAAPAALILAQTQQVYADTVVVKEATDAVLVEAQSMVNFQQAGAGAVVRTMQDKAREVVSVKDFGAVGDGVTDDTAAIQAAVTHCFSAGDHLYWPDGAYLTAASISNFHSVRHVGAGVVRRGSDLFYVEPKEGQTNRLYLGGGGSASNDGLSSSQPFNTFQPCFDATKNYGPVLSGSWELIAAAGTYTISAGQQTFSTPSVRRVVIRGPVAGHPNVPTAIVDGGGNGTAYAHGLSASGPGVIVEFRDIKFQNFTEASGFTRIGLVGQHRCDFLTTNVHTFRCSWMGINATVTQRARISGGIIDADNVGAYGIVVDTTECSLGYLGGLASNRPIIKKAISAGIYWSTGSQGHADYCDVEDNGVGFLIAENSRCDTVNLNFKRNTVAVRASTGGVWGEGGALNDYNQGTADADGTVLQALGYSGNISELEGSQSGTYLRVAFDRITRTASGAAAYSFPTIYTLKGYRLQGAGKSMRVHVKGAYTVTVSSTVVVNVGAMELSFTVPAAATNVAFEVDVELMDVTGGYRASGRLSAGLNATRFSTAAAGFDNTIDSAISISGSLAGAGDSINIYRTDIYLMG